MHCIVFCLFHYCRRLLPMSKSTKIQKMAYPIVFFGVRDSVMDIFEVPMADQTPDNRIHTYLTVFLLGILTMTAMFVTDLGLINAVGGGAFVCWVRWLLSFVCIVLATTAGDGYRFSHSLIIWLQFVFFVTQAWSRLLSYFCFPL
jgi:hypothetical protein